MKTVQDFAETLNGSDPTDVLNVAELAVSQDFVVQFEESVFQSGDPATTDPAFESKEMVRISLDQIFVDGSIHPRATLDVYTVQQYAAALIRGEKLPPITVEGTKDHDYRVLKGVLRFQAYRLRRDIQTGKLVADFYDEPLPLISDTELNTIQCFIDTVPPDTEAIISAMKDNQKHGKPPTSEDYKKVARELYKKNVGAPIQDLAKQIKIGRKLFKKYVTDLVEAFEEEKKGLILELDSKGIPATEISHILKEKFPKAKGLSDTQVSDFLKKEKTTKASNHDQHHTNDDGKEQSDDTQCREDNTENNGAEVEEEIEHTEPSPIPVELKVVYGNASDTIMIMGLTSLLPDLQEKLKSQVEALVNQIREENSAAHEDKEDPDQDNPEGQDKAPENPETDVNSNQASTEKSTAQKFRPAILPTRGSRPLK